MGPYSSAGMHLEYSTAPVDWAVEYFESHITQLDTNRDIVYNHVIYTTYEHL